MIRGGAVLYLDFDGVLHHENCVWHPRRGAYLVAPSEFILFQHAELLAELLAPYPEVKIVLSTSWVLQYGYATTAKRLPVSLRQRCVGATFHSRAMGKSEFRDVPRGIQVWEDVQRRQPVDWLALDDNPEGWSPGCLGHFVQTHQHHGISEPTVLSRIKVRLAEMSEVTRS